MTGADKNIEQANLRDVRMNKVKRWNSTDVGWWEKEQMKRNGRMH